MFRFQRLIEEVLSRLGWTNPELSPEDAHALVINADGARTVVIPAMQPHQHLIRRLAQGVERDEPGGMKEGGGVIASRLE
jgi:hypothetical protein